MAIKVLIYGRPAILWISIEMLDADALDPIDETGMAQRERAARARLVRVVVPGLDARIRRAASGRKPAPRRKR